MRPSPITEDLDPRWPLPCVELAYVREEQPGVWVLRDFYGQALVATSDRSTCFFEVIRLGLTLATRH